MYDFSLVKKKKRNRRVAIASSIGAIGVIALIIVAFLGQSVGTFTINLKNDGVALTLDTHSTFENQTSYLSTSGFGKITGQYTYPLFKSSSKYSFDQIDSEDTTYEIGQVTNSDGLNFFKYTFFVKNVGTSTAAYELSVNLSNNQKPSNNSNSLDTYLRLMLFEQDKDPVVYARRSQTRIDENNNYMKEYICGDPNYGEAEMFIDDTKLASVHNILEPEEYRRYTFLFWLEGNDPEGNVLPENASLRIGATINAYQN